MHKREILSRVLIFGEERAYNGACGEIPAENVKKKKGKIMEMTPTAHNSAVKGEIARRVLMPGDPLRAEYIAKTYLENPVCFNRVRNMLGYTGTYKGREVSVMGGGMGMPSIGIYSYELYHFYGVEEIIRIGSAGGLEENIKLRDIVLAMGACTDSAYARQYGLSGTFAPIADYGLLKRAEEAARESGLSVKIGNVLSSDAFYHANASSKEGWRSMGVLAVEMEAAALYMNAAAAGKRALCLLTISDLLFKEEELSSKERQEGFGEMLSLALSL